MKQQIEKIQAEENLAVTGTITVSFWNDLKRKIVDKYMHQSKIKQEKLEQSKQSKEKIITQSKETATKALSDIENQVKDIKKNMTKNDSATNNTSVLTGQKYGTQTK